MPNILAVNPEGQRETTQFMYSKARNPEAAHRSPNPSDHSLEQQQAVLHVVDAGESHDLLHMCSPCMLKEMRSADKRP